MKNLIFWVLLFSALSTFAQGNLCESGYMPFKEGISYELTSYDKKDKVTSVAAHRVSNLEEVDGGYKATIDIEIADPKGKNVTKGSYSVECSDGVVYIDMSSLLDPRTMESLSSMEVEMSGDALELPAQPEPGQTLPDGTLTIKTSLSGMALMTMSLTVTNRKVEAEESVTTPAGTFDCVKISQDTELKAVIKKKFNSATWYAKGIGLVKTINYDSKGNAESSTVLTKMDK